MAAWASRPCGELACDATWSRRRNEGVALPPSDAPLSASSPTFLSLATWYGRWVWSSEFSEKKSRNATGRTQQNTITITYIAVCTISTCQIYMYTQPKKTCTMVWALKMYSRKYKCLQSTKLSVRINGYITIVSDDISQWHRCDFTPTRTLNSDVYCFLITT